MKSQEVISKFYDLLGSIALYVDPMVRLRMMRAFSGTLEASCDSHVAALSALTVHMTVPSTDDVPEMPGEEVLFWQDNRADAPSHTEEWASTDRGWLWMYGRERALGSYIDYGPNHYRSPHEYCRDGDCTCELSQPGHVHAVVYEKWPEGTTWRSARFFETVDQAKRWIEECWHVGPAERDLILPHVIRPKVTVFLDEVTESHAYTSEMQHAERHGL